MVRMAGLPSVPEDEVICSSAMRAELAAARKMCHTWVPRAIGCKYAAEEASPADRAARRATSVGRLLGIMAGAFATSPTHRTLGYHTTATAAASNDSTPGHPSRSRRVDRLKVATIP